MSAATVEIRDAVAAAIVTGATDLGSRVFLGRVAPLKESEFPAGCVLIDNEREASDSKSDTRVDFDLVIEVVLAGDGSASDIEASVDDLLSSIWVATGLDIDPTLSGRIFHISGTARDRQAVPGGERFLGRGRITVTAWTYL
jgi:hypothetical protein